MTKYIVDIKGEIEGDYEIIGKYEERPKGEWIESDVPESILSKCSVCGFNCGAYTFNYCPNCGADMREADNDYTKA